MQKPTAVVGRRVVAYIIDYLIAAAIVAVAWYALTKNVGPGSCIGGGVEINGKCRGFTDSGNRAIWIVIAVVAYVAIFWIMQGLTGKTPGKAVVGIKVVKGDGQVPGVGRAALRSILWIIDGIPGLPLVGFVTALASRNNQRVGDMAAGTFVVDKNFAGAIAAAQPAAVPAGGGYGPPPSAAPATTPPPPQPQGGQAADWYPDPQGQARLRYWDGQRWTDHTSA